MKARNSRRLLIFKPFINSYDLKYRAVFYDGATIVWDKKGDDFTELLKDAGLALDELLAQGSKRRPSRGDTSSSSKLRS